MTLGERIKRLRKLNDMSQQQLADYLEINRNHLSRIETNKSDPTSTILMKLSALFEVNVDSLIGNSTNSVKREEKKKYIIDNCNNLPDEDLDFIVRIIFSMKESYVKRDVNILDK